MRKITKVKLAVLAAYSVSALVAASVYGDAVKQDVLATHGYLSDAIMISIVGMILAMIVLFLLGALLAWLLFRQWPWSPRPMPAVEEWQPAEQPVLWPPEWDEWRPNPFP